MYLPGIYKRPIHHTPHTSHTLRLLEVSAPWASLIRKKQFAYICLVVQQWIGKVWINLLCTPEVSRWAGEPHTITIGRIPSFRPVWVLPWVLLGHWDWDLVSAKSPHLAALLPLWPTYQWQISKIVYSAFACQFGSLTLPLALTLERCPRPPVASSQLAARSSQLSAHSSQLAVLTTRQVLCTAATHTALFVWFRVSTPYFPGGIWGLGFMNERQSQEWDWDRDRYRDPWAPKSADKRKLPQRLGLDWDNNQTLSPGGESGCGSGWWWWWVGVSGRVSVSVLDLTQPLGPKSPSFIERTLGDWRACQLPPNSIPMGNDYAGSLHC